MLERLRARRRRTEPERTHHGQMHRRTRGNERLLANWAKGGHESLDVSRRSKSRGGKIKLTHYRIS